MVISTVPFWRCRIVQLDLESFKKYSNVIQLRASLRREISGAVNNQTKSKFGIFCPTFTRQILISFILIGKLRGYCTTYCTQVLCQVVFCHMLENQPMRGELRARDKM